VRCATLGFGLFSCTQSPMNAVSSLAPKVLNLKAQGKRSAALGN
jgi:hypothetical protein